MSFDSFSDFLAMGGHAFYVWSCFALGMIVLLGNVIAPMLERKKLIAEQLRRIRREESKS
ncbi:MAG: heme exporter protein CcmD [Oceanospirillales bacterium]|nr:MAG: heme exporter protein CcmD [Oceanospirillales bacterium]